MNLLYCYITATEQEHIFLYKTPEDNNGKIYINLLGTDGEYYQIFGEASKEKMGTSGIFYDFEAVGMVGGDFGNFLTETIDIYIVNRFSGHIKKFLYHPKQKLTLDKNIQQCSFGEETPSPLPEKYIFYEPIIFIKIFIIVLILIGGIYFFKKSKHKK